MSCIQQQRGGYRCFGKSDSFSPNSTICKNCYYYVKCKKEIYKNLKIPKSSIVNIKSKRKGR
jgi:hypothetical protein